MRDQDPGSPLGERRELAQLYRKDRYQFNKLIEEFTLRYAM
jgi:hypothetical protein